MADRPKRQKMKFYARSLARDVRGPFCVDLFSGAGGLAEGFRQAGWHIVSGSDIDVFAAETFRQNFPAASFFQGPISLLKPEQVLEDAGLKPGELDCLIG